MDREVIVHTMPGCPACVQVKEFLSRNGIDFEERVVTQSRQYYTELVEDLGFTAVPVTLVDGTPVLGYDRARLAELLGL